MSARRIVIAVEGFWSPSLVEVKHPRVSQGLVRAGASFWSDDPIVLKHPTLFVDADTVPGPHDSSGPAPSTDAERPSGPEWIALVRAHKKAGQPRPKLATVARNMGWDSEQPLRDLVRRLGIARWYDVHALVAAEPD